jgi:hypothetical protein
MPHRPLGALGWPEVVVVVAIFLIIFGPRLFGAGPPRDPFSR